MARTSREGDPTPAPEAATVARLLERLDTAGYWTEHLIIAADCVGQTVIGLVQRHFDGALQDADALAFLLEEAKCSAQELRNRHEELEACLNPWTKAGRERRRTAEA